MNDRTRGMPFRLRRGSRRLVVCSVCLGVRDGSAWIEAGEVIRRLRTFENEHVVRLGGAVCARCRMELRLRRGSGAEELAA